MGPPPGLCENVNLPTLLMQDIGNGWDNPKFQIILTYSTTSPAM